VVERSFGWMSRFRRLARDYERLPETEAGQKLVKNYWVNSLGLAKLLKRLMAASGLEPET
jgi:transposase